MTIITEFNCDRHVYKTNNFHPHTHTFVHLLYFSVVLHIFMDFQSSILSMSTSIDFSTLPITDLVHPTRHDTDAKRIKLKCSGCRIAKRKTEFMRLPKLPLQDISNIIENGVKLNRTCDACSNKTKIYGIAAYIRPPWWEMPAITAISAASKEQRLINNDSVRSQHRI